MTISASSGGLDLTFPVGTSTIRATVSDLRGNASTEAVFTFMCTEQVASNRPFETRQIWFLKTARAISGVTPGPMPEGTTRTVAATGMISVAFHCHGPASEQTLLCRHGPFAQ